MYEEHLCQGAQGAKTNKIKHYSNVEPEGAPDWEQGSRLQGGATF